MYLYAMAIILYIHLEGYAARRGDPAGTAACAFLSPAACPARGPGPRPPLSPVLSLQKPSKYIMDIHSSYTVSAQVTRRYSMHLLYMAEAKPIPQYVYKYRYRYRYPIYSSIHIYSVYIYHMYLYNLYTYIHHILYIHIHMCISYVCIPTDSRGEV